MSTWEPKSHFHMIESMSRAIKKEIGAMGASFELCEDWEVPVGCKQTSFESNQQQDQVGDQFGRQAHL